MIFAAPTEFKFPNGVTLAKEIFAFVVIVNAPAAATLDVTDEPYCEPYPTVDVELGVLTTNDILPAAAIGPFTIIGPALVTIDRLPPLSTPVEPT